MLLETIRHDMTAAMKARDEVRLRSLRAVIAATQQAQAAGPTSVELTDDDVKGIISTQVKQRLEAAEAFESGGATDRAAAEREEMEVLSEYLPARLTDEELEELVNSSLADGGWKSKADMGTAMKAINAVVDGRADGKAVAQLVKSKLQ